MTTPTDPIRALPEQWRRDTQRGGARRHKPSGSTPTLIELNHAYGDIQQAWRTAADELDAALASSQTPTEEWLLRKAAEEEGHDVSAGPASLSSPSGVAPQHRETDAERIQRETLERLDRCPTCRGPRDIRFMVPVGATGMESCRDPYHPANIKPEPSGVAPTQDRIAIPEDGSGPDPQALAQHVQMLIDVAECEGDNEHLKASSRLLYRWFAERLRAALSSSRSTTGTDTSCQCTSMDAIQSCPVHGTIAQQNEALVPASRSTESAAEPLKEGEFPPMEADVLAHAALLLRPFPASYRVFRGLVDRLRASFSPSEAPSTPKYFDCPTCWAEKGQPCRGPRGIEVPYHRTRVLAFSSSTATPKGDKA